MSKIIQKLRPYTLTTSIGLALGLSGVTHAAMDDIVVVKGSGTDTQTMSLDMNGQQIQGDPAKLCKNIQTFLAANELMGMGGYGGPGTAFLNMIFPPDSMMPNPGYEAAAALNKCANTQPSDTEYTIMFTSCSMHMYNGESLLVWVVPPEVPEAMDCLLAFHRQ